jgi:hypothetical protein
MRFNRCAPPRCPSPSACSGSSATGQSSQAVYRVVGRVKIEWLWVAVWMCGSIRCCYHRRGGGGDEQPDHPPTHPPTHPPHTFAHQQQTNRDSLKRTKNSEALLQACIGQAGNTAFYRGTGITNKMPSFFSPCVLPCDKNRLSLDPPTTTQPNTHFSIPPTQRGASRTPFARRTGCWWCTSGCCTSGCSWR